MDQNQVLLKIYFALNILAQCVCMYVCMYVYKNSEFSNQKPQVSFRRWETRQKELHLSVGKGSDGDSVFVQYLTVAIDGLHSSYNRRAAPKERIPSLRMSDHKTLHITRPSPKC